jgi:hypothetical protein
MLIGQLQMVFGSRGKPLLPFELGKFQMACRNGELTGGAAHRTASVGFDQRLTDAVDLLVELSVTRTRQEQAYACPYARAPQGGQ